MQAEEAKRNSLQEAATDATTGIAKHDIDGFRCDAVRYLSEFGPDNQAEQGRTHEVWKEFRIELDGDFPDAILLAEAPTETYSQMLTYYGNGDEFHSAFHFKLPNLLISAPKHGSRPSNLLSELYAIQSHLPAKTQDVLFLSNHDQFAGDRVASQLAGDIPKIKSAASLYLLLSGAPAIYYAEELAAQGGGSDNAIRQPLDWNQVRTQSFDEDSVLNHYKRLLAVRNQYAALHGGATYFAHAHYSSDNRWDNNQDDGSKVLTLVRELSGEKVPVVHNFGGTAERIHTSLDSTSLTIPNGTSAYSLMGSAPAEAVTLQTATSTISGKCSRNVRKLCFSAILLDTNQPTVSSQPTKMGCKTAAKPSRFTFASRGLLPNISFTPGMRTAYPATTSWR